MLQILMGIGGEFKNPVQKTMKMETYTSSKHVIVLEGIFRM